MTPDTYPIAVNRSHRGKHPPGMSKAESDRWFGAFNGQFHNETLTVDALAAAISDGYAITAHVNGYRKAANFICAQHVGVDLDDGSMPLEAVLQVPAVEAHASIVYTTASHTPERPRLRVIYLLDRPIRDPEKYRLLVLSILHYFGAADPMCKDPARIFFGSPGCELVKLGNVLTLEDAAATFVDPYRIDLERLKVYHAPALDGVQAAGDVPAEVLQRHADRLLHHVSHAPNGEKYYTLRDIARTFGGYVAGGYYAHGDVVAWLRAAIEGRRHDIASMEHAYKTIDQWVALGENDPLVFERRPKASPAAHAQAVKRSRDWQRAAIGQRLGQLEDYIAGYDMAGDCDPAWPAALTEYDDLRRYLEGVGNGQADQGRERSRLAPAMAG